MGWWRIDDVETGGIACKFGSNNPSKHAVCNAIPGRDSPEDQYNGDGPADIIGYAIGRIDEVYREVWGRSAHPDEVRACFNFVFNGWIRRKENERASDIDPD